MILYLAALQNINLELYEAANIDGASVFQKFVHITVPMVSPTSFYMLIMGVIAGFQGGFNAIYIMTGGGPGTATELISIKLYNMAFPQWQTGKSCALAYILLIMIIGISNIYIKYLNKAKER